MIKLKDIPDYVEVQLDLGIPDYLWNSTEALEKLGRMTVGRNFINNDDKEKIAPLLLPRILKTCMIFTFQTPTPSEKPAADKLSVGALKVRRVTWYSNSMS